MKYHALRLFFTYFVLFELSQIIAQNEERKAKKLSSLMVEMGLEEG